jgi:hypothetical protein
VGGHYALDLAEDLYNQFEKLPDVPGAIWRIEPGKDAGEYKFSQDTRPRWNFKEELYDGSLFEKAFNAAGEALNKSKVPNDPNQQADYGFIHHILQTQTTTRLSISRVFFLYLESIERPLKKQSTIETTAESSVLQATNDFTISGGKLQRPCRYLRPLRTSPTFTIGYILGYRWRTPSS